MSNKENTSEEIDLGQLFKLIGDGFNRFFHFIASVFKGVFHFIIIFLQFIRKHFIKFAIAGVVGVSVGWYFDSLAEPMFRSTMIVEPNFGSTKQLYNDIRYYNELATQGASKALSEALQIDDITVASTIKRISIEPFSDETQKLREYNNFIKQLDTASRKGIDYGFYSKNMSDTNAKFHTVIIEATDSESPKKCQEGIVESIVENEYFKRLKSVNDLNIIIQDSIINSTLKEIDSLQAFYQKLEVLKVNKPSGTTSINLAETEKFESKSEIELLESKKKLKQDKLLLNTRKAKEQNIINVISDFNDRGSLLHSFINQKKVLYPIFLITLTFLVIMLIHLNRYLKNYNNPRS